MTRAEIPLILGKYGEVREPRVHDAHLLALDLAGHHLVTLRLREDAGTEFEFVLEGVERFKADDLREGNIVLDMAIRPWHMADDRDIAEVYGGSMSDSRFSGDAIRRRLGKANLVYVEINPSYGCSLRAFCREVKAFRR